MPEENLMKIRDSNTVETLEHPTNRNKIRTMASARNKNLANGLGRGAHMALQYYDEVVTKETTQLTDEEVDKICETIREAKKDDKDYQMLTSLPSNNGVEGREVTEQIVEEGETKTYTVNPDTGQFKEEDPFTTPKTEWVEKDFNVTLDNVISYSDNNEIEKNIDWDLKAIKPEDIFDVVDIYQKKNKIKYKQLPSSIRTIIYNSAMKESGALAINPEILDLAAEHFASTMMIELQAYKLQTDYDEGIKQVSKEALHDLAKTYQDEVFNRQKVIQDLIEKESDEEKKKLLQDILHACVESYELNEFKEAISNTKIKIKKIDIDKPQKVFAEFNYKYEYDEKFNIMCGIHHLVPIIQTFANMTYSNTEIALFLVLFCKYCRDFKPVDTPEGITQHTFMSSFISNMYSLRMIANGDEQTEFVADIIKKINEIIGVIRKSNYKKFISK